MEELTTEQKIIDAARKIFTQKGYAATKTRDISEAAGINLALLNYYFGSKENLFKLIVLEKFKEMFGLLNPVLSDENVSLEEKVKTLVDYYTNLLSENEDLPIFVLSELKNNERIFDDILQMARTISQPVIEKQLKEKGIVLSPANFVINIISLTIFPFVAKPMLISSGIVEENDFAAFIEKRKQEIPVWINKMSTQQHRL
ncbi:MAG: TetR/AcrR family transcriptional regulator [Bacteroidia bacterium]|nr:TetR/AcrR family transcriptional regulator [Bacteroidia bacterium]